MFFCSVITVLVALKVTPVSSTYALSFVAVISGHGFTLGCPVEAHGKYFTNLVQVSLNVL